MSEVDQQIEQALAMEQKAILAEIGEPGFLGMALGMFSGRLGWVNALMMVVQSALFIAGVVAAWQFFEAGVVVDQLRWGLPAAVLLLLSAMIKMAMWPTIHADRLMREIKRLELLVIHS